MKLREQLVTERLTLSPVTTRDTAVLLALLNEPEVGRYLLDGEQVGRGWVQQVVEDSDESFRTRGAGLFLAHDNEGALVGLAGFRAFFDPPELQLLYALHPSQQGRGYATEMARVLVQHAFTELGFEEVRASTDAPNVRSIRVLERLGMELIGREPGPLHETLHFAVKKPRGGTT